MVVTENDPLTPPMMSVAETVAPGVVEDITRTRTYRPGSTEPGADVYGRLSTEYSPPVIEMGTVASVPETMMMFDVIATPGGTPSAGIVPNGLGVVDRK